MNLKNKFCDRPFKMLEISPPTTSKSPCYCCCPSWLPHEVGDLRTMSLEEVWNSETMQAIRRSILLGNFSYCNKDRCPEISSGALYDVETLEDPFLLDIVNNSRVKLKSGPRNLNLAYDLTCNLSCPSCRDHVIVTNSSPYRQLVDLTHKKIMRADFSDAEKIIVCSSGDPFASHHFSDFLLQFDATKFPKAKIQIVTNGVLLSNSRWESLKTIHNNIGDICISLDAATEATYNIVRRGGNFQKVISNITFLSQRLKEGCFDRIRLDFVVQKHNFKEMEDFIKLGKELGVTQVYFQKILNLGTFSNQEFKDLEIDNKSHPNYQDFLDIINRDIFEDPIVNLGNLFSHKTKWLPKKIVPVKKGRFSLKNAIIHTIKRRIRILRPHILFLFKKKNP